MINLLNKSVVIPGGSRPVGRHIAKKFAAAGANLILPWFDWPESVAEMIKEFTDSGVSFLEMECDLRDKQQVDLLVDTVRDTFGSIDFLINNIERGGMPVVHGSYEHEHNREQWDLEIATTLKAKWLLYTGFKGLFRQPGGSIINISSIAAEVGRSGPAACFYNDAYSAANSGVHSFTKQWAREMAPAIRVNELVLGLTRSRHGENTRGWKELSRQEKKDLFDHTLLGRTATEQEVAELVFFLATTATYMTGSIVTMDGGYLLGGAAVPGMPPGIL